MAEVNSVTVIIPAKPGEFEVKAIAGARALDFPVAGLEVILARGKQPSVQRNTALRAAKGEVIYFLDDDSVPRPENLRRVARHFADPKVQMVGGPNVCPADAPWLEQVFARALAAWLGFGPSRARYTPVGQVRDTTEKELILCNLAARRESLLELGGFNEALYPNEENALMDELQKRGGRLVYDPEFVVERRPRRTLGAFARMLMTYGRGRAEQFRLHPTVGSALNFVPPLFCVYLVLAPFLGRWGLWPLALYGVAVLGQGVALALQKKPFHSLLAIPLVVMTHVLYGIGFWRGLFTKVSRSAPVVDVVLERK